MHKFNLFTGVETKPKKLLIYTNSSAINATAQNLSIPKFRIIWASWLKSHEKDFLMNFWTKPMKPSNHCWQNTCGKGHEAPSVITSNNCNTWYRNPRTQSLSQDIFAHFKATSRQYTHHKFRHSSLGSFNMQTKQCCEDNLSNCKSQYINSTVHLIWKCQTKT